MANSPPSPDAPTDVAPDAAAEPRIGRAETAALVVLIVAGLVVRALWIARRVFDSDEAQHFHVAWGWANGRVQYRDLWDNHMPLFHLATAPLAALFGERADVLVLARIAMVPLT